MSKASEKKRYRLFGFSGIGMAQLKRTRGGVDPEDNIAKIIVIDQQLRETRDYLARGRRFANLDEDALNECWIAAYRGLLHHRGLNHGRDYHDLSAEFELRKVVLPYERVKHIFEANVVEANRHLESEMQLESETWSSRELEENMEELLALALACYSKSNEDEEPYKEAS